MTTYTEAQEMKAVYEFVKLNKNRLPDYWQDKGIVTCIEGICCMVARGKYSDEAIAGFYECPVALIEQIKIAYKKTIKMMEEQHKDMVETFGDLSSELTEANDRGLISLLCEIFKRCRDED